MTTLKRWWNSGIRLPPLFQYVAALSWLLVSSGYAYPLGRVTFYSDAPFLGTDSGGGQQGANSLTATGAESLLTFSAWADTEATVPASLSQWFWLLGVDSGGGNYALIDGTESMTVQVDKSVGVAMLYFLYTGGYGGTTNNLARISISGFKCDPGPFAVTSALPRISNFDYTNGTLSFDYLYDSGTDFGQVMLENPMASAGQTLKIAGAVSPNGDATGWGVALFRVDVQEAYAGPQVSPTSIPLAVTNTYATPDGWLTIRGYADTNATVLANLGTYLDECFAVQGGSSDALIDTNESITLQFAGAVGLSRLDLVYSKGGYDVVISGFLSNPGLVDPSAGALASSYSAGTLTITLRGGSVFHFYFADRTASAGQTLRINVANTPNNHSGIAGIGYANIHTFLATDIPINISPSFGTPDGLLTLTGYSDTPGSVPAILYELGNWIGISGGSQNDTIDGAESLNLQFAGGTGLSGIGTIFTSGQVIISGFKDDPGFSDPSGMATNVNYSGGTLSYTFNALNSSEIVVVFTNLSASIGQSLTMYTDGNPGSQLTLTRINYANSVAPVTLSIARFGGSVVLNWPNGTLQQSTNIAGIYSDVIGATSPYTNSISGPQRFFRVKAQ
jgi:hypothetical protein